MPLTSRCAILKSVFSKQECDRLCDFLDRFKKDHAPGQTGKNSWQVTASSASHLESLVFGDLLRSDMDLPRQFFGTLYEIYERCGTALNFETYLERFPTEAEPVVFIYPAGFGKLERHRHQSEQQKFQLVANLTQSGRDYLGGETVVELSDGSFATLDSQQGDVQSFPYNLFHQVNAVKPGAGGRNARISLLMPIFKSALGKNIYG